MKADRGEFIALGSHASQQALQRLDLAFAAFFRRVKAGQTPGFPRTWTPPVCQAFSS